MKRRCGRFNIYLAVLLGLGLAGVLSSGCRTAEGKRKHEVAIVRFHIEGRKDVEGSTQAVPIHRQRPVTVHIVRVPIMSEENVKEAKVRESMGGFELELTMDRRGRWLLENYTASNVGRRLAIFSAWGGQPRKQPKQTRWLGAPRITHRISNGVLAFTPDTTREEAEAIAIGLNNSAKKLQDAIE